MKKRIKKPKKPSVAKLKKLAWKLFSIYIRSKDADWNGMVHCYTCSWYGPWRRLQAGHFVPGRGNAILFEEKGVFPQCWVCNIRKHGNTLVYMDNLIRDFGKKRVNYLRGKALEIKQFDVAELEALILTLKKKIKVKI